MAEPPLLEQLARLASDRRRRAALIQRLRLPASERDAALAELARGWRCERDLPAPARAGTRTSAVLRITDAAFPSQLAATEDPPPLLFHEGLVDLLQGRCIAIVGSRRASPSSLALAEVMATELAESGYVIVSGMARGVDAAAHRGALAANAGTIAVLGAGFDRIYPREHVGLFRQIVGTGLVLTEHPADVEPLAPHFPRRNRIISGLSLAVVVIEAARASGSLGTAREALEQGRDVLVVPGTVAGGRFAGSHRLLREGAVLVESAHDVREALGESLPAEAARASARTEPDGDAGELLRRCSDTPLAIDVLAESSGIAATLVRALMTRLELEGFVASSAHGYIRRR